jgi:S-methylmethionine-dependent homocysteine/selenocysteine methylase
MSATLPHLNSTRFLTDGGMETSLVFDHGLDLPAFASFPLLDSEDGRQLLASYFVPYLQIASAHGAGFVFETPTWRANPDWGAELGYDAAGLERINRESVDFMRGLVAAANIESSIISGAIGPRGDGYVVGHAMSADEAAVYHRPQIEAFAAAGVDMVTAFTITYADEGVGIARAAKAAGVPAIISFTLETDGQLPSGEDLGGAIERVDTEAPDAVAYFMVNCAHPTHFADMLPSEAPWLERIGGIRANASTKSHAELDASTELDPGDPIDLGARYRALEAKLPNLKVLGGCCGTDYRHVAAIAAATTPAGLVR